MLGKGRGSPRGPRQEKTGGSAKLDFYRRGPQSGEPSQFRARVTGRMSVPSAVITKTIRSSLTTTDGDLWVAIERPT